MPNLQTSIHTVNTGCSNSNLHKAKSTKNDEFYTQFDDIVNEMNYYKKHFQNQVVFCNCDDPEWSNFWKYFSINFDFLGLKKLIATHYDVNKPSYKLEMFRDENGDIKKDLEIPLLQNGDFRSDECVDILSEVDIVVTNPPFSLFREFIAKLMEYNKKFLIIGSQNAITYKETFKFLKSNDIWLGNTSPKEFISKNEEIHKFGNIIWFTNLDIEKRHEDVILYKTYYGNESEYPKYDNYNAINVDKVKNIPMDYEGAMGVPISFMNKYNPNQFEIISSNDFRKNERVPFKSHGLIKDKDGSINGKAKYVRILIKNKQLKKEM